MSMACHCHLAIYESGNILHEKYYNVHRPLLPPTNECYIPKKSDPLLILHVEWV